MVRKTVAVLAAVLLGWMVLLGAPAQAAQCSELPPNDIEFPASCIDGEWVHTDDGFGFGDDFSDDFDEEQRSMTIVAVVVMLGIVGLGIGAAIWRVNAARNMARRSPRGGGSASASARGSAFAGNGPNRCRTSSAVRSTSMAPTTTRKARLGP